MSFRVKREEAAKIRGGESGSSQMSRTASTKAAMPLFSASMDDAEIGDLLRQLDAVSRKLSMYPTERVMYEYRCIVGELMRRLMTGFHLRKDLRWRRSDKSLYVTIEKIESDLDELEEVFQREGLRTRGFLLIEEIKGCLISLLV